MTFDQLMQILASIMGPALGAVGAYVAIRSDLAAIKARIEGHNESFTRAHERIDSLMSKG